MQEKLKIGNRHSIDFGEQIGISLERREKLAEKLNEMTREARSGKLRFVRTIDIVEHIHDFCDTKEEFIWCLLNHMEWMYRAGRIFKFFGKQN